MFYILLFEIVKIAIAFIQSQIVTCYNDPESHPFITTKELTYLKIEIGQVKRNVDLPPTPWLSILTSVPVVALVIAQLGHDWVLYVISADLPKYLKEVLKVNINETGLYTALPFLAMWIFSIFSGFLCDHLIVQKYVSATVARKIFTFLGMCYHHQSVIAVIEKLITMVDLKLI